MPINLNAYNDHADKKHVDTMSCRKKYMQIMIMQIKNM
jgi:hypothetical protein